MNGAITRVIRAGLFAIAIALLPAPADAAEAPLQILLLGGSSGSHKPKAMADLIIEAMDPRGIQITYTENVADLNPANLANYAAISVFKDDGDLPPEAESALLTAIDAGKGFVPIHCASHAFRNSPKYGALVGGRFDHHGHATFPARIIDAQHPAMLGLHGFDATDETYSHNELNKDIQVLMVRDEAGGYEPYTWVRRQGKGRVFYTALGHDERTWGKPEFQDLFEHGIRWAAGELNSDVEIIPLPDNYLKAPPPAPLAPAESMRHMHLPEGFTVSLFAAEPEITRPIAMALDEHGRAWIAESVDYPNDIHTEGTGNDRIKICEDTDGDGRADKFTVFAEHLNIPTAIVCVKDGVIVAAAPQVLRLTDTNGDGISDERTVLLNGFGKQDTHAGPGNFRYGFDNWIWGTVGYSGGDLKVGDHQYKFSAGLIRFKPDGSEFEYLTPTQSNTWGLSFDESGRVLVSKANDQHAVQFAIPNRPLEQVRGLHEIGNAGIEDHKRFHPVTDNVRQVDWFDGYTAASGMTVYTARALPEPYWNRAAFVCEPTGHLIHTDFLVTKGTEITARDGWNLMASTDPWCAPIETHVGPQGEVWFVDWYNYIVRHNPTPPGFETGPGNAYVTDQRDHARGRIYRIVYNPAKPAPPEPMIGSASVNELLEALKSNNLFTRLNAQRLLVERGNPDVGKALAEMAQAPDWPHTPRPNGGAHALRTLKGLDLIDAPASEFAATPRDLLTTTSSPAVRLAAIETLPVSAASADALVKSGLLAGADSNLRLSALRRLAEMPGSISAGHAIAESLIKEPTEDRWLVLAAVCAAAPSDTSFLESALQPEGIQLTGLAKVVQSVANHFAREPRPDALARVMGASAVAAHGKTVEALLAGLESGWPADAQALLSPALQSHLVAAMPDLPLSAQGNLARLTTRWGLKGPLADSVVAIRQAAQTNLANASSSPADRKSAARLLAELADPTDATSAILAQVTPQADPALAADLIEVLAELKDRSVADGLLDRWSTLTPSLRPKAFGVLTRRPLWVSLLLNAIKNEKFNPSELALDQKRALTGYPDRAISKRATELLAKQGGSANPDREKVVSEHLSLATSKGDPTRGRDVFEKNCATCHRFNGIGNRVGPELTGIAARSREDILTDVLDPNRSVEGNFHQWIISTKEGEVLNGLVAAETQTSVELIDTRGEHHPMERAAIQEIRASQLSLMPEGFEEIGRDDLANLLEYLTQHGRYMPLPIQKAATAPSDRGMFYKTDAEPERIIFPEWGEKTAFGVPFNVVDPRNGTVNNVILLNSPIGEVSAKMPKEASLPCNSPARAIHILGGVSGWGFPGGTKGSTSLILRLHYKGGAKEDHPLRNGEEFADYIREIDVPGSKLAFNLNGRQVRYLPISPARTDTIETLEFIKGDDQTAPVIMAVTVETGE